MTLHKRHTLAKQWKVAHELYFSAQSYDQYRQLKLTPLRKQPSPQGQGARGFTNHLSLIGWGLVPAEINFLALTLCHPGWGNNCLGQRYSRVCRGSLDWCVLKEWASGCGGAPASLAQPSQMESVSKGSLTSGCVGWLTGDVIQIWTCFPPAYYPGSRAGRNMKW